MKKTEHKTQYDIIIVGGGPAGLCFARALDGAGLAVAIIEKQAQSVLADPPYDGREIALTHRSRTIMGDLGIWKKIQPDHISLIRHAHVLNGESPYALSFSFREAGRENLGFMVSNNRIRKAAYEAAHEMAGLTFITGREVARAHTNAQGCAVELADGEILKGSLLVAADSRFSALRRMMGIPVEMLDFGRVCIVCKMSHELPHAETAYECFHYDRTLAVLPLNNQEVSVVITLPASESEALLAMPPEDFAADMERRTAGRLGAMSLISALHSYPLISSHAVRFHGPRFALLGDAAVGMHPVTAHGFNLGLRGAHTLAGEIRNALDVGGDIGAHGVLERYSGRHRQACRPLYLGTNALVKLYTKNTPAARLARGALLRLGNRIGPAKKLIMNQLTEIDAA
ncbi:MAG: 5-demethoxyubiquinol-8 5-hydroxylase UbiM [Alphaproteobacteria bacterium]|nr:5-demethoxyubiquinol-8 5-hydroxylase UbiM [Alphaproteobacteria bacterium]